MNRLEIVRGTSADWLIRASDRVDGSAPETGDFLDTDTLAATVSKGEGYASLFAPDVSWAATGADVTIGKFGLSIDNTDTSGLESGDYLLTVTATRSGRTAVIARAVLRILGTTGELEEPAVYCEYKDLEDELPWIGELKDESSDLTGFLLQRGQARQWMDGLILASQPSRGVGLLSYQNYWTWDFGGGGGVLGSGNTLGADSTLKACLDDDCLMLTTPYGRKIVEACIYWTLAKILRRTSLQRPGVSMSGLADRYGQMANFAACNATAEIDTNDDGTCDIAISLAVTNTRYA